MRNTAKIRAGDSGSTVGCGKKCKTLVRTAADKFLPLKLKENGGAGGGGRGVPVCTEKACCARVEHKNIETANFLWTACFFLEPLGTWCRYYTTLVYSP